MRPSRSLLPYRIAKPLLAFLLSFAAAVVAFMPRIAEAVPSYARQTGLQCTACHEGYLILNNYGRQFKLSGFTSSSDDATDLPPLAAYLQPSFTQTQKGQPGGAAPHFAGNSNFALTQASLFYAGRLFGPYPDKLFGDGPVAQFLDKFGTYFQATYDGVGRTLSWDNCDLRYADMATIFGQRLDYGLYANNNPTEQDMFNTVPAWRFPYSSSGLAPTPSAATLIEGGLSQQVVGIGAYALVSKSFYFDFALYHTLSTNFQRAMGVDPTDEADVSGVAPYWRLAYTKSTGHHSFEAGLFGLDANVYPGRDKSAGQDNLFDLGFDTQYQYSSGKNEFLTTASLIYERERWSASQKLGNATNRADHLFSTNVAVDYLYDKTYGANIAYFISDGSHDPGLYSDGANGSPLSSGVTFELNYLPFNKGGGPAFWPKSNVKFSIQYTVYTRFNGARYNYDGAGRNAKDNNTLYLEAWIAF